MAIPGPYSAFPSRRSVVHSTKGIVSTTSPLANEAGLRILREGGNAADAAVAAAAVLNLVDPAMTGIGGDVFCLFYDAHTHKVHALNGSGRSPAGATLEDVCRDLGLGHGADREHAVIPPTSALSVTVPGAAAAWVDVVDRFGAPSTTMSQVLAPAIDMAEHGAPISEIASYVWIAAEDALRAQENGADLLKRDPKAAQGCRAPRTGELYTNPVLAAAFRRLAEKGKPGFYEGPIAEAIVDAVKSRGGYLALGDLENHGKTGSELTDAVSIRLDFQTSSEPSTEASPLPVTSGSGDRVVGVNSIAIDLWEPALNAQGVVAQMALGILQELQKQGKIPRFRPCDHNSAAYLHALIESLRIAFADAAWHIADPHTAPTDASQLLAPGYLARRAGLFDPSKAGPTPSHGSPGRPASGDTVYLAVTDAAGNACSFINSVAREFGSRIVPVGTGFVLHNRGAGFRLDEPHPNAYAPGKRPYSTLTPALATRAADGGLHTVLGVMGGAMQPQGHAQVLLNMEMFGMNPQAALDAPRVCIGVSLPGMSTDPSKVQDETVYLEDGVAEDVVASLARIGHQVKVVTDFMDRGRFGRGQVIRLHDDAFSQTTVHSAGSDMRGDGAAAPFI